VTNEAFNCNVVPAQIGPSLLASVPFTVAVAVAWDDVQPLTLTVTLYVPAAAIVAFGMVGFCRGGAKLFGPVQVYVAPVTVEANNCNVWPGQIGPLFEAVGGEGIGVILTNLLQVISQQLFLVTFKVKVNETKLPAFTETDDP